MRHGLPKRRHLAWLSLEVLEFPDIGGPRIGAVNASMLATATAAWAARLAVRLAGALGITLFYLGALLVFYLLAEGFMWGS
ncbi:MAG: hypothetical protein GY719_16415 [bacterium]|nr:hypothetical protein [bacterium]